MKTTYLLIFIILSYTSSAQVKFQNISFDNALSTAKKDGKIILLQFESNSCKQCNEVANKAFEDQQLAAKLEQTFIPIKITTDHRDRSRVSSLFNINEFGTFFIDHFGALIHSFPSTSTSPQHYFTQANIALNKAGESLKVRELEELYNNGNRSIGFIEFLLHKKKSLNLTTNCWMSI